MVSTPISQLYLQHHIDILPTFNSNTTGQNQNLRPHHTRQPIPSTWSAHAPWDVECTDALDIVFGFAELVHNEAEFPLDWEQKSPRYMADYEATIRTDLLIFVDKIITTPFEIFREIKMIDLEVNKLFINILGFYLKIIEFSKVFMSMIENN
jgi:hypothetical protein